MSETKKTDWDKLNVGIEYLGRAITLPAEPAQMPTSKAIEALVRKQKDEEQVFSVVEKFDAYPTDAAVAVVKAMTRLYGWASPEDQQTFFGKKPPSMLSVKTSHRDEDVVQVPIGQFKLPGVDEPITTGIYDGQFILHGDVKKRDRHIVLELAVLARKILKEESIYRGKPIKLMVDDDGDLIQNSPPEFFDVTEMVEENLIFDRKVQDQVNTNLLTPLRETELCRKHKIPLRRGILLEGPYGTGKSLLGRLTARIAEQNGWTFVLLDKVQGLKPALEFAVKYAPSVVFAEDIDRIITERTDGANDLINTIDGVGNKTSEIMTVLTTNFVDTINPSILRPGRLDAIISLRAPTAEACQRLIRYYAGNLLQKNITLAEAGKTLEGMIPASVRECVDRAKLGMVSRRDTKLVEGDLIIAAQSMKHHMELLNPKPALPNQAEVLASSLKNVVNGHNETIEHILKKVKELHNHFDV